MLIVVRRKRRTESSKKRRQPQELACHLLQDSDRATVCSSQFSEQKYQALKLGRFETDSEAIKVKLPANPHYPSRQASFVPAHGHIQD